MYDKVDSLFRLVHRLHRCPDRAFLAHITFHPVVLVAGLLQIERNRACPGPCERPEDGLADCARTAGYNGYFSGQISRLLWHPQPFLRWSLTHLAAFSAAAAHG